MTNALHKDEKNWVGGLAYVYLQHNQADKAIALWLGLLEQHVNDPEVLKSLSYAYYIQGDHQKAIDYALTFLDHATNAEATPMLLLLSRASWAMGLETESKEYMKQYLTRGSVDAE